MNRLSAMPITARKSESPFRSSRAFELLKRANKSKMVLPRMFQSRNIQKKRLPQTETFRHAGLRLFTRTGMKTLVVQAVVNHRDPFARQSEEFYNIASGVFTN